MSADPLAQLPKSTDPEAIERQVQALLDDPLYWFGVRHHSHTAARHLKAAIQHRRPRIIFVEGPFEAKHLVPFLVDSATVPPVAIYSSYRDDANVLGLNGILSPSAEIPAKFAVWYPVTEYSPEYVAMKSAHATGAEVVFIDLPHYALISGLQNPENQVTDGGTNEKDEAATAQAESKPQVQPTDMPQLGSQQDTLFTTSGFYQSLAAAAGFESWDEAWDTLFENPQSTDFEAFRRDMASFCCAVRGTSNVNIERATGTIARERHFMKVIRDTLAQRGVMPEQAMVVCGGFHLFLDRNDEQAPPPIPDGTKYCTVVPYSFFQISELTGYSAGNRAPQFYQTCYQMIAEGRDEHIAMEHAISVLRQVRKAGDPLSTADAIAITHHAKMLSALRGRNHTTLDDIDDAIITCCCKGDPTEEGTKLRTAMDAVGIGTKIGKVTDRLGRLPIVADFYDQIAALSLNYVIDKEKKFSLRLDKREALDAKQSAFLHRMVFLKVPLASLTSTGGDFSGTLFREDWGVKWDPKTEPALIEQTLYGDTIERAALHRLREVIAKAGVHSGEACVQLLQAVNMELQDLIPETEEAALSAIDNDSSFASLATAMRHASFIERVYSFQGRTDSIVEPLLTRSFQRACLALSSSLNAPDEEHMGIVQGLTSIADILQRADKAKLDRGLFVSAVKGAANDSPVPFLRGAFIGLLCELRELPAEALAAEVVGLAQSSSEIMVTAGEMLDGMLAASRTSILLGADPLIAAIDDLLIAAKWEDFLVMLPRLRAAFERLSATSRHSLAATVAKRYSLGSAHEVSTMHTSIGATALVAKLDAAVEVVLKDWPL
ncbi:MAG: DUF5682 family protein [Pirellulaceae bacterium]|nr:DUF5682 family protein [Pirellulaceae bacterium]